MKIKKNDLTLQMDADGSFTCDELVSLPTTFEKLHSFEEVQSAIDDFVAYIREKSRALYPKGQEPEDQSEEEKIRIGQERLDAVVADLKEKTAKLGLFETFLFWFGSWWYYHPTFRRGLRFDTNDISKVRESSLSRFLVSTLPQPVKDAVQDMSLANVATGYGHFALLFIDQDHEIRRIVTDTQLFEIRGVLGYVYLDITPDGKPIARSVCKRGGGRAFFDGVRLMSHERFETCAPKTIIVNGGYKVNSTYSTIVNGMLFDLIDADDKVAHTDGAFLGMCDFTSEDLVAACELAEQSGKLMTIDKNRVTLNGTELKPIGIFAPAKIALLNSGFALYDWSDFHEIHGIRYNHIIVVDDKQGWIDAVVEEFGTDIEVIEHCLTNDADEAFRSILESGARAVLLDMHLTDDERFDGIWIANQLANKGFTGQVFITSSYSPSGLQAIQSLIKISTKAPGKDLKKVRLVLSDRPID